MMCKCDFSTKEYLDAVVILHPVEPTRLMVLLGEYTFTHERDDNHLVLGNVRHNSMVECDTESIFEVASSDKVVSTPVLPILFHLIDYPEDVVVITADLLNDEVTWAAVKKAEKASI